MDQGGLFFILSSYNLLTAREMLRVPFSVLSPFSDLCTCGHVCDIGPLYGNWLFKVTINDISVIYVTAHICAGGLKKKLDLRSGSHAIDIS